METDDAVAKAFHNLVNETKEMDMEGAVDPEREWEEGAREYFRQYRTH